MLNNRFFTVDDKKLDELDDFKIPLEWWSRSYEYYFASTFLKEDDVIVDAGCGIEHPFKYYAAKRVKKVYAVDRDKRLESLKSEKNIEYMCKNLESFYPEEQVDKIFCISVLEHVNPQSLYSILENFASNLKDNGQLILTIDYPLLKPENLKEALKSHFIVPNTKYKEAGKDLYSSLYHLKCYSMVAKKKVSK